MKHVDAAIQTSPWSEESSALILKKTADIPALLNDWKNYFPSILPCQNEGIYYAKVKLIFTDEFYDLHINLNLWMKGEGYELYGYSLQVEKTIKIR